MPQVIPGWGKWFSQRRAVLCRGSLVAGALSAMEIPAASYQRQRPALQGSSQPWLCCWSTRRARPGATLAKRTEPCVTAETSCTQIVFPGTFPPG